MLAPLVRFARLTGGPVGCSTVCGKITPFGSRLGGGSVGTARSFRGGLMWILGGRATVLIENSAGTVWRNGCLETTGLVNPTRWEFFQYGELFGKAPLLGW